MNDNMNKITLPHIIYAIVSIFLISPYAIAINEISELTYDRTVIGFTLYYLMFFGLGIVLFSWLIKKIIQEKHIISIIISVIIAFLNLYSLNLSFSLSVNDRLINFIIILPTLTVLILILIGINSWNIKARRKSKE
ncbi:hypothetical protein GO491_08330 [Flavobacteriaceae bacterium Ap0902]|nr:hypothetical protein [Flavobacteriaceae bacterium Ap0902]